MKNTKGLTLIELVLVITIIGILIVFVLPMFYNISTQAEQASRDGVASGVRSGIALYRANDMVVFGGGGRFPTTLDDINNNTQCSLEQLCFATVLTQGISDGSWQKVNSNRYRFTDGTDTFTYTYNIADGSFTAPGLP